MKKRTLYLVDGNGYIHRAYHALPPLTNSKGEPVGALYGFIRMLQKILKEQKPDFVAVCFDTASPTFRHKAFEDYKATRKEIDDALRFQLPLAKELVRAWGLPVVSLDGFEADDVIATLAAQGEKESLSVVIVTADKDALQLVNENIIVLNEQKGIRMDESEVEKKYGLPPSKLVDYFALTGDSSDNVPGVPGIGPKTAAELIQKYGSLEKILETPADMKDSLRQKLSAYRDMALKSRDLVVLDKSAAVSLKPLECLPRAPDPSFDELVRRFEFQSILPASRPVSPAARRVRVVQSEEAFEKLAAVLKNAACLAVDTETTGLDPMRCRLVGISVSAQAGEAWYIPVGHAESADKNPAVMKEAKARLGALLADPDLPKTGHNLKYDLLVLRRHGLAVEGIAFDTLIASYCLNPSRRGNGLKDLASEMLQESMTPIEELIGAGARQITMDQVEIKRAAEYAGADAEVALRLKEKMSSDLKAKGLERLFNDVEMPLVALLADMEEAGVKVDLPYLEKLNQDFESNIAGMERGIREIAGEDFNPNSPKQLQFLLFEKFKLPVIRRTKTGASTDEEVLKKLSPMHPLPAKIVEYRELSKLKSTYLDALLSLADSGSRVHTSFNQAVAATGRLSSSNPNLQNIPIRTDQGRQIRRSFIAEKGMVLLSADYSQIDLRVLAHMSGDENLSSAFQRGEDVHAATAREIFGLKGTDAVSSDQRRVAKTVNFGIVYGQTAFGLSQQLGIDNASAKDYIEKYFANFHGVKAWMEKIILSARKEGFVSTLLGRVRYLPEITAQNAAVRQFAERTAMNTPIQGTSADIIKVAMVDLGRRLKQDKRKTRMLLQVHDELLFEVPAPELKESALLIRERMEEAVKLSVPLVVDLKTGENWLEMEKIKRM